MFASLSRAHRRVLGLLAPVDTRQDYVPVQTVVFGPGCRSALQAHLATAGVARGGLLIGQLDAGTVHVRLILPAGFVGRLPPGDPLAYDPSYLLGAVDVARLISGEGLDWVGTWVMRADGHASTELADEAVWWRARRRALVSDQVVFVTVGQGRTRLVVRAYVEDDGQPVGLKVAWGPGREGERA